MLETVTKKIYYKKYDRRLIIKVRYTSNSPKSMPTSEVINWLLDQKFEEQWRGITSYSYVDNKQQYTVFFKDEAIFDYLKEQIKPEYLVEYEKPLDAAHTHMLATEKVVVRKILFHNKYRIAIRCEPMKTNVYNWDTSHMDEMKKWCREQFGREYDNKDRYMISGWHNTSFFFADPKDAMMFKLVHQDIKLTERCVLVSEMEAARTPETTP